jgi:hypothetical protein
MGEQLRALRRLNREQEPKSALLCPQQQCGSGHCMRSETGHKQTWRRAKGSPLCPQNRTSGAWRLNRPQHHCKIQRHLLQGRHICWARRVVKSKSGKGNQARHKDLPMDDALFIYRNSSGPRFCDPATQQMRGGTEKVIVYVNGVLCAMDREAKITIPVSRWKLAEIGLGCFLAALKGKRATPRALEAKGKRAAPRSLEAKGKRAAPRSLEARPLPESPPETFPACPRSC